MIVHVRRTGHTAYCGGPSATESISWRHFVEHVLPHREDCCANLWARLCAACVAAVDLDTSTHLWNNEGGGKQ